MNELLDVLEVALYWCLLQLILAQNYVLLTLYDYGVFFCGSVACKLFHGKKVSGKKKNIILTNELVSRAQTFSGKKKYGTFG